PPVLVVDAVMLSKVEPDKAQGVVPRHPNEQIHDVADLPGLWPDRGLGQQHRLASEAPPLAEGGAENGSKPVRGPVVEAVNAYPADVLGARPPCLDRAGTGDIGLD